MLTLLAELNPTYAWGMNSHSEQPVLRLPHKEAVAAVMELVQRLSPDPTDYLVTLRAAEEVAFKLLPLSVEQNLVDLARHPPEGGQGATWMEVGNHLLNQRAINTASEGLEGPDVPLTPPAAYARFGPTREQRSIRQEAERLAETEILPGFGRQEMADRLGVAVNTVTRWVGEGKLTVRTVTNRRGVDHKRYFENSDLLSED